MTSTAIAGLLLLVIYLGLLATVWRYGQKRTREPADAAVVLGAAIYGAEPSPVFRSRIDHAIALYESDMVERIIFTGGKAAGDELAESEAARDYAVDLGVEPEHILVETRSTTTWENLVEASALVEAHGVGKLILVSDPMHMRRVMAMARDLGLDCAPSPTPTTRFVDTTDKLRFAAREAVYLAIYWLRRH